MAGHGFRLASQLLVEFGLEFSYVDTSCLKTVEQAIKPSTRMIYIESPSNPTMIVTSHRGDRKSCAKPGFSPWFLQHFSQPAAPQRDLTGSPHRAAFDYEISQRPQRFVSEEPYKSNLGAEDAEKIYFLQRAAGAGLAPMDRFLTSRGIKTLAVRMDRHNSNNAFDSCGPIVRARTHHSRL